jgi:hypothetical protein
MSKKSSLIGLNQINTQNVHTLYIKNMSLTLRKKTLHQNFKVMSLQYVKKSNNYLSQSNIDKIIDFTSGL